MELNLLADGLKFCQRCSQTLRLDNIVGERKSGLGLILLVKCGYAECSHVNSWITTQLRKDGLFGMSTLNLQLVCRSLTLHSLG